jgi:hypothetical protein
MTEEETALYGLLWTMAEFKKHNKDVNDSLVSRSIDYFDHHGDKRHRALAYYYRGAVRHYAMHRLPEAIKDLKMAEGLSEGLDDWQLKSKIDEQLAFTNYYSQNAALAECRQRARNELLSEQYFKLDLSDHHTRT